MPKIQAILLFVSDLSGEGRFNKRDGAFVRVNPPRRWLEEADEAFGFNGVLLEWIEDHGLVQRFDEFTNGDHFRTSVQSEFPDRDLKYRHCRTEAIGYNLVVVCGKPNSQAISQEVHPISNVLTLEEKLDFARTAVQARLTANHKEIMDDKPGPGQSPPSPAEIPDTQHSASKVEHAKAPLLSVLPDSGMIRTGSIEGGGEVRNPRAAMNTFRPVAAVCDLCNEPASTESKTIKADHFKSAVTCGVRPPAETIAQLMAMANLSSSEVEAVWIDVVETSSSDWLLCPQCASRVEFEMDAELPAGCAVIFILIAIAIAHKYSLLVFIPGHLQTPTSENFSFVVALFGLACGVVLFLYRFVRRVRVRKVAKYIWATIFAVLSPAVGPVLTGLTLLGPVLIADALFPSVLAIVCVGLLGFIYTCLCISLADQAVRKVESMHGRGE